MKAISFTPKHLLYLLLGCDLALAALYGLSLHIGGIDVHQLFDMDQEANIPAWFSSTKFFCIAALLGLYGPEALGRIGVPRFLPLLGAIVFLFLSMDESAQVHERVGRALRGNDFVPTVRNDRGAWVFVYLVVALPFLYLAARQLPKLWLNYRVLTISGLAGCAFIACGAAGVELIADQFLRGYEQIQYYYKLSVLAEETSELLGTSLLLFAAFTLTRPAQQPTLQWQPAQMATGQAASVR